MGTEQTMLTFDRIFDIQDEWPGPTNACFRDLYLKQMKKYKLEISIHNTGTDFKNVVSK